jgi:hypothetical protein
MEKFLVEGFIMPLVNHFTQYAELLMKTRRHIVYKTLSEVLWLNLIKNFS